VENILRFLAYTISGSPCYADKFMVLTGEGSNGKSRFINVIRQLIGEKFTVDAGVSMITKENQRSAIDGKLLCIMEEIPAYKNEDFWEVLKSISTGGYLHADIKFKEGYSFKNVSKFIFTCNKLPAGTDPTGGWYRRFLLIPFLHKFDRSDSDFVANIDEKIIENELPGVFNRVWGAYSRLVGDAYGFVESAAAQQAMEAFKLETDTVLQWIKEFGVTQIGTEEFGTISNNVGDQTFTKKDLYDKYKSWAIDCGYKPVGKITFLGRLSKSFKYDDHPHTFPDGRRERRVRGIRLVDEFSAEAPF
jgi:putative DNA primase/helicase